MVIEHKKHHPKTAEDLQISARRQAFDSAIEETEIAIHAMERSHINLWQLSASQGHVFERLQGLETLRGYLIEERDRTCAVSGTFK